MGKTGIPGVIIASVPWWTKGAKAIRGYVWKKYHFPGSIFQRKQQLRLSRAATAQYGRVRGFINGIPAVGATIADQISGSVGGMSKADRREIAHRKAGATITKLERLVSEIERGPTAV